MLSSTFAPIAPPTVILPIVAVIFACSAGYARINYHRMEHKLSASMAAIDYHDMAKLKAIANVFKQYPMPSLIDSLNPAKNLVRTWKSVLGGILINPFWMPIFYMMGIQIKEEANLGVLAQVIIEVEHKLYPVLSKDWVIIIKYRKFQLTLRPVNRRREKRASYTETIKVDSWKWCKQQYRTVKLITRAHHYLH